MSISIEQKVKKRAQRESIQKNVAILLARLTAQQGRLLFVPRDLLVKRLGLNNSRNPNYKINQALQRLEKKGIVTRNKNSSGWGARLTPMGEKVAKKFYLSEHLRISKPPKWDGRWRVIIFDIWERRKPTRERLRRALRAAGFYMVQDSVWTHPYDCEELLVFLRADLRLGSSVLYLIAEGIEGDVRIKRHFGLN